jgi:hypothetical protein
MFSFAVLLAARDGQSSRRSGLRCCGYRPGRRRPLAISQGDSDRDSLDAVRRFATEKTVGSLGRYDGLAKWA